MRFKAYRVKSEEHYQTVSLGILNELYTSLVNCPKLEDEDNEYAVMYLKKYEPFILGTFVQAYNTVLTKFKDKSENKEEVKISESEFNDKTLFYIDFNEKIVYIQSKRYPETLNPRLMKKRMEEIFSKCLGEKVVLLETEINNTIEQIEHVFKTSTVKKIVFSNMKGLELPKGSELHNPRKDLDDALVESYNVYSKDTLDYMELRAKNGEDLHKNPFAKIGMTLSDEYQDREVFKYMEIIEGGEKITVRKEGNNSRIVNIGKKDQDSSYVAYEKILKSSVKGYTPE